MTAPDLLPCPFCGTDKVAVCQSERNNPVFWVECIRCNAEAQPSTHKAEAIAAWNRRADTPTDAAQTRVIRNGEHLFNTAKSLGWADDGEGALEFVMRRTREVALEDAAQVREAALREAAIRECADALRKVIDYAAFAGADPDEVEDEAINSYADYLLTLIDKP